MKDPRDPQNHLLGKLQDQISQLGAPGIPNRMHRGNGAKLLL